MNVLHIDSSAMGDGSASRQLATAIVSALRSTAPNVVVRYRDLDAEPLPHLTAASLTAADPRQAALAAEVLAEFQASDVLVIGAPMYNFSIPSTLKAWIDRIVVAGKTFRYTAEGPQGLAGDKRVIVVSTRGGQYGADSPADFQESYLRHVFGFIGVNDLHIVRAEGLNLSPAQREAALKAALAELPALLPRAA
ncbi:FMN-dependent NADH-azoreductase [Rehaibacterium terrae]|jgi:FMN-dependent NADH-azoreductase|uniref:FMN dependent NADH:quinone oxidoreductase n=1 Tax=Rehaibacterium terrae TaxID=1341696 RepID=A0A7W8DD24_9GAMM|nr:NAD(P)H-dependent oxidoreductase [Rehaibacterium terrae]MBB5014895.1 FMN-dependent NADH-azoreductase [Rehaibacterium terrae]